MLIDLFFSSPITALIWLIAILVSLSFHEFAHALIGTLKGDMTAKLLGRLTINPLAHISPIGFLMFLFVGFGWAKPVPYNPYNLKHPKTDAFHIALAGPFSNLLLALLSSGILALILATGLASLSSGIAFFLIAMILINISLAIFNLIPLDPLDGSKVLDLLLDKPHQQRLRESIRQYAPTVLLFLVIVSITTSFNPFFFISIPAEIVCESLTNGACFEVLSTAFSR